MSRQSREELEALALLKEVGAEFLRNTRHGNLYKLPNGERVGLPQQSDSSLDPRAWANALSCLKRKLRNPIPNPEEPMTEPTKPDLAALGVHVESTKTVVEKRTHKATVIGTALAMLLGLAPEDENTVVNYDAFLTDVNGKPIEGPYVLTVHVEVAIGG